MPQIRPHHIRRAWLVGGSLIVVAVLGVSTIQTVNVLAHEEETLVETIDESIAVIDVANSAGSIEIVGRETDEVVVTAHVSDGLMATHHSEEVDGDRLVLRASCPWMTVWCDVDYEVEAPPGVDVVARSSGGSGPGIGGPPSGGSITVDGITGSLDLAADHGGITVVDAEGRLTLDSDHGSIDVVDSRSSVVEASTDHASIELGFAEPPDSVNADSFSGNVRIVVPDDGTSYRVDVSAGRGGSADTEVDTDRKGTKRITARADHGDVLVTYRE